MRSFSTKLTAILTVAALGLAATSAFADHGNKGKKSGGSFSFGNGGFGASFGNSGNKSIYLKKNNHHGHHHHHCHTYPVYPIGGYPYGQQYGQAYEPFHCWYICQPGDVFYTVAMKEYGTGAVASHIARFNQLPLNAQLVAGQRIMLPSVSSNGVLSASRAPMPFVDATNGGPFSNPTAKLTTPKSLPTSNLASNVTVATTEPSLPSVVVGSTLVLDGQVFGEVQGLARLRVGGLSLPIKVLEWTNS
jgi:hypothetical protein